MAGLLRVPMMCASVVGAAVLAFAAWAPSDIEGPVASAPTTTETPRVGLTAGTLPPDGSFDVRAEELCRAHLAADPHTAPANVRLLAAFDSTIDAAIGWYDAVMTTMAKGTPVPGPMQRVGDDARARWNGSADRFAAMCWTDGDYSGPGLRSEPTQREVRLIDDEGQAVPLLAVMGSSLAVQRPEVVAARDHFSTGRS